MGVVRVVVVRVVVVLVRVAEVRVLECQNNWYLVKPYAHEVWLQACLILTSAQPSQ